MHADAFYRTPRDERDRLGPAVALAIGLHLLLLLLIVLSSWFDWNTDTAEPAAGSPAVEASLVMSAADIRAAERAMREAPKPPEPLPEPVKEVAEEETVPPPQPIPEPQPQDSPVPQQQQAQERIPVPDTEAQEEASRLAISQEKAEKEQEEKRRQEQIDLTERKRQEEAERKQRLAQQEEADRQKQLDEIRRQRAQAARETQLAEQKLRQLADARARNAAQQAPPATSGNAGAAAASPGQGGTDDGLLAKYKAAIQSAVARSWTRPDTVTLGTRCRVKIKQLPGGEVMSAEVDSSCPMDQAGRDSVERAVLKAQPLPYRGFESVFARDLNLNFEAQDL